MDEFEARVEGLEVDLRHRDEQIKELRDERSRAIDLVDEMREHIEDANELIESWKEAFDMELADDGMWHFHSDKVADAYTSLLDEHKKLLREWNKFVGDYNSTVAPRGLGRPLEASEAQVKNVRRLRKAGKSLRAISTETGLGLRTVRTIVGKDSGTDRTSKRTNLLRKRVFDKLRAAEYRSRKRVRDQLPKRITETLKRGEELLKAAKGLDD